MMDILETLCAYACFGFFAKILYHYKIKVSDNPNYRALNSRNMGHELSLLLPFSSEEKKAHPLWTKVFTILYVIFFVLLAITLVHLNSIDKPYSVPP